jgi:hypothetical protein
MEFNTVARRLGLTSAVATVVLVAAYAATLTVGLAALKSPDQPIANPMFSILEILIIVMMPVIVCLMIAVHAFAPPNVKALSFTAVVLMALLAGLTSSLHFVILTLSHQPTIERQTWLSLVLTFKWPSVAYALDILAWDVFFALSILFAAPVFRGSVLTNWIRWLMAASGTLALAGLSGVAVGNMQLRNIGLVGYVPVFLAVAVLLGVLFYRTDPVSGSRHTKATVAKDPGAHAQEPTRELRTSNTSKVNGSAQTDTARTAPTVSSARRLASAMDTRYRRYLGRCRPVVWSHPCDGIGCRRASRARRRTLQPAGGRGGCPKP